jgi:predicted nuclease of predicted toxin-antitoxin system
VADGITFYVDEHFPMQIVKALRDRDIDVRTTQDAKRSGASDPDQLHYAAQCNRILVTQDTDFLQLNAEGYEHIGIVFIRQRTSMHIIIEDLTLIAEASTWEEFTQQVIYVP